MIRFTCKCGFEFNVTDDHAGETRQCPRCGLLVDVPSAAELAWLGPDGTIAVDNTGEAPTPGGERLAELVRAFAKSRYDEFGREIDLRPTDDHFDRVGNHPSGEAHRPERIAPRYDPVTGERILPLALKDEPPQDVIPMAELVDDDEALPVVEIEPTPVISMESARVRKPRKVAKAPKPPPPPVEVVLPVMPIPVGPARPRAAGGRPLGYAAGEMAHHTTLRSLPVDLLVWPANTVVLCFVFAFYWLAYLLKVPLNGFAIIFNAPPIVFNLLNLPMWALVAHYGCVVEDVGPDAIDELPRPLRNFSPIDDLFAPAVKVTAAAALCFGAAFIAGAATGMDTSHARAVTLGLAAVGCYFFPAVVMTLLTGSTVLNLTPLRVLGVIGLCGGQYLLSVALAAVSLAGSAAVLLGPSVLTPLANFRFLRYGTNVAVLVPVMFAMMYVTHLFAWHLGLLYRAHHEQFPWQAQRHVPTPRGRRMTAG